jgi:outer membrane lipoprotein-sorting protein
VTRGCSLLAVTLYILAPSSVVAGEPAVDAFLRRLAAANAPHQGLTATFLQRKQMSLFRTEVITRGQVQFRRPDTLRWETFAPDASQLLVKGERAEFRLPGTKPRVIDLSQGGIVGTLVHQMLVWLGARPADDLAREYKIKLTEADARARLQLVPRQGFLAQRITSLELEFDTQLILRRIAVHQKDGDNTLIEFQKVTRGVPTP